MALHLQLNGQPRSFENLTPGDPLASLITALELKGDRIAVEHNGEIVPRTGWPEAPLADGDRLEVVHFVGGGTSSLKPAQSVITEAPGSRAHHRS